MASELIERRYKVSPEEVGNPLSQEDMYEFLKARRENMAQYDWFLSFGRAREVFESLRSDNRLVAAEILETIEQPDASEIKLQFRWPVKSDIVYGEHVLGTLYRKEKSHPSAYSYVTVIFNRVERPSSDPEWIVFIEGKKTERVLWVAGSLRSVDVKDAIQKAFSNPETKDFESSGEELTNPPLPK